MFLYVHNNFNPSPSMTLSGKRNPNEYLVEYWGAPLYLLPRTVAEFESSRGAKYWQTLRRKQKHFESDFGKLDFAWVTSAEELEFWLPKVHELFLARWSDRYVSSSWKTAEGFAEYARALFHMAAMGQASLAILSRAGELLSFSYNLHQDNIIYFYQHATKDDPRYHKYSLGRIFLTHFLREVIASARFNAFDFMVGEAGYKFEWADRTQRVFLKVTRRENEHRWHYLARVAKAKMTVRVQKTERLKNLILLMMRLPEKLRQIWTIKPRYDREAALSN